MLFSWPNQTGDFTLNSYRSKKPIRSIHQNIDFSFIFLYLNLITFFYYSATTIYLSRQSLLEEFALSHKLCNYRDFGVKFHHLTWATINNKESYVDVQSFSHLSIIGELGKQKERI